MILEIAEILIRPGENAEFEAAIALGLSSGHTSAKGMRGYKLHRCIESPQRYVLQVHWDRIEDHISYRDGPLTHKLRSLVLPLLAEAVSYEHFEEAFRSEVLPA